jgi:exodeoxyribonuclease VII small subunit
LATFQEPARNAAGREFAAMSKPSKSDSPASFEAALSELEKIVASMESGKFSLEQSLAAHKRGLELAQYCQNLLAQAQQQVKMLEENALKNFPPVDADD